MNGNSGQFKSQQELERKASVIILDLHERYTKHHNGDF